MPAKRATSVDVARAAGVSQSTVSRTFSGARVSPKKRQQVLDAATLLGYSPNAIARSLSMQRTNIVGVVMADMASPFNPYVLEKFTQRLQQKGQQVLFFSVPSDRDVDEILPQVFQYQVDALILTSTTLSSEMVKQCIANDTPVVLFNRTVPEPQVSAVCGDNRAGGRLAADLLLDAQHERLAYIAGLQDTSTNRERESGFTDRLRERGYTSWRREQGEYSYQSGFGAAERLLTQCEPPDAIFCASDVIALGVIDQARQLNIRIPDDLSIIGFDDIPEASWMAYDLTTIRQPVNRMVEATLDLLEQQLSSDKNGPTTLLFPGTLVLRSTVRLSEPSE